MAAGWLAGEPLYPRPQPFSPGWAPKRLGCATENRRSDQTAAARAITGDHMKRRERNMLLFRLQDFRAGASTCCHRLARSPRWCALEGAKNVARVLSSGPRARCSLTPWLAPPNPSVVRRNRSFSGWGVTPRFVKPEVFYM